MQSHRSLSQTGILLIAHAPLASAMMQCVLHIFPDKKPFIASYDVTNDLTPDEGLAQGLLLAEQLHAKRLLIFTDIMGATPFNLAKKLMKALHKNNDYPVRLICGTNIPMLLRAMTYYEKPIDEITEMIIQGGQQGITCLKP